MFWARSDVIRFIFLFAYGLYLADTEGLRLFLFSNGDLRNFYKRDLLDGAGKLFYEELPIKLFNFYDF